MKTFASNQTPKIWLFLTDICYPSIYPLWKWKEEEDATVNPENSWSQLLCSTFLFSMPQISAPLLSGLHLSDDTYKHNWLLPAAFLWTKFFFAVVCLFCDLPLICRGRGWWERTVMRCRRKRRQGHRNATGCLTAALSAGAHGIWWVAPNHLDFITS